MDSHLERWIQVPFYPFEGSIDSLEALMIFDREHVWDAIEQCGLPAFGREIHAAETELRSLKFYDPRAFGKREVKPRASNDEIVAVLGINEGFRVRIGILVDFPNKGKRDAVRLPAEWLELLLKRRKAT